MKSYNKNFEYIEDFVDYLLERVETDDGLFLTVVGEFCEIKEIAKEIIISDEVDFDSLQLINPDALGYKTEYVLGLYMNDGVIEIECGPLRDESGICVDPRGDETYLIANVDSKIVSLCGESDVYCVDVEEFREHEYGGCCCNCSCKETSVADELSYFVNGRHVTKQEYEKKYDKIEKLYRNGMSVAIGEILEHLNDINNFRRHL